MIDREAMLLQNRINLLQAEEERILKKVRDA
jgi:hypothetical protein